jgi:hypothetical protein
VWNEILKIKPILDQAAAKLMQANLSGRFAQVAQRFGKGLQSVIKGSILGISLGLLNKLLNPLEALEDKIKSLLGQGTEVTDMADRLGTSPGQLQQLQDVAASLGVGPDQFKTMITKYAEAIEKGRQELANPFEQPSAASIGLKQFVGEKDIAKSFTDFLASLQARGKGEGEFVPLSARAQRQFNEAAQKGAPVSQEDLQDLLARGEIRKQSGLEARQAFEKEVFGETQFGAGRRLIEANIPAEAKRINEPAIGTLNAALTKTADLAAQKRALDVQNQTADFVKASGQLNQKMITDMAAADKVRLDRETKQLESFEDLKKASIAIEQVKGLFETGLVQLNKGVGYLADLTSAFSSVKKSRLFNLFKGGGSE